MRRAAQVCFAITAMANAWLWMQIVHELGHVAGGLATGARIERLVLHPLAISRTDVSGSRAPLAVIWAGPICGVLVPLFMWGGLALVRSPLAWLARFFAGFCLLANGLYLGAGSFDGVGDCGDLLRHGSPIWTLWLFGLLTAPLGMALWNGLGPQFGFGREAPPPSARLVALSAAALAVTMGLEMMFSPRF